MSWGKLAVIVTVSLLTGFFFGRFSYGPEVRPKTPCEQREVVLIQQMKRMRIEAEVDWTECKVRLYKAVVNERIRLTGKTNPEPLRGREP